MYGASVVTACVKCFLIMVHGGRLIILVYAVDE